MLAGLLAWAKGLLAMWGLRLQMVAIVAAVVAALAFIAVVYRQGKRSAMVDTLEKTLEKARDRMEIKDRQLEAANRRPADRDELERLLERGEF